MINDTYSRKCFQLGRDFALHLASSSTLRTSDIALDFEGVLGLSVVEDNAHNQAVYAQVEEGIKPSQSLRHYIMPYPGAIPYILGINTYGQGPLLVTRMTEKKGLAIFRKLPLMQHAFLDGVNSSEIGIQDLRGSSRVFFAHDLANGMMKLLAIERGKLPITHYPQAWWPFIESGIEAVHESQGKYLLKLPIVVALSKPGVSPYQVILEGAVDAVDPILNFSNASVIQPAMPWSPQAPFQENPDQSLAYNCSRHMRLFDQALREVARDMSPRSHYYVQRNDSRFAPRTGARQVFLCNEEPKSIAEGAVNPLHWLRGLLAA